MNEEQLKAMASQLSCPTGEDGILTADMMHFSNIGMTRNTINALTLAAQDRVLELGHGNGHHIPEILSTTENISYYGLEISELMNKEASLFNKEAQASFMLYDGENIPFEANYFNKIMTVNTLYFWKNPVYLLNEIYRVLQPAGKFVCTFAEKAFMEKLPFTKFVFELYDRAKIKVLIQSTAFKKVEFQEHTEQITSKDGQSIERNYTVAIFEK
ncbi:MAG: class I SAM-dependent methyltransferase [Bacteroidota bacterium]